MTSLFADCPRCGKQVPQGNPCPHCHYSADAADPAVRQQEERLMTKYAWRYLVHWCNYALFMLLSFCLALATIGVTSPFVALKSGARLLPEEAGILVLVALISGIAWLPLAIALFASKWLFPTALKCPKCEIRVDELGLNAGHCPGCSARLR